MRGLNGPDPVRIAGSHVSIAVRRSLLAVALSIAPLGAQDTLPAWPKVPPVGSTLRVETPAGRTVGKLERYTPRSVVLLDKAERRELPLDQVMRVDRRRRSTGTGALVGGAVGAAAFTGFLHFIISALCDSTEGCQNDHNRAWGYGIVLGGAGGALLGAGVGSLIPRWERVFTGNGER
jgi:hypothetical protein